MNKTPLVKVLVLFSSITLVIAFLLFRGGIFDVRMADSNMIQSNSNSAVANSSSIDTVPAAKDSMHVFSSSRVAILKDSKIKLNKPEKKKADSSQTKKDTTKTSLKQ